MRLNSLVLRRYHLLAVISAACLVASVELFSRDTESAREVNVPVAPKRVALTFDDGPHPAHTQRLLDILTDHKAHATFFVVGKQAIRYPHVLRAMARAGHQVANHTTTHPPLTALSSERVVWELDQTQRVIERHTRQTSRFFRPPGGRYNSQVLEAATQRGYRMVLWNVFPRDHLSPSTDELYRRVMDNVQDGSVVLFHSGIKNTEIILPQLIEDLRSRGYEFYTVSGLLQQPLDADAVSQWYFPVPLSGVRVAARADPH